MRPASARCTERQVMAAIVEDVERDLGRRRGIDVHVPIAGDREEGERDCRHSRTCRP